MEPRCKKCGRILSNPISIARGMGPKCAGISGGGRSVGVRIGRRSGTSYSLDFSGGMQATLPIGNTAPKRPSRRELTRGSQEERRRLFGERKPFQCGVLLPERKPIIYTPTEDGGWKINKNGGVISHDQLQSYLKRYQFI